MATKLQEKIELIKKILTKKDFYILLCQKSDNNVQTTIINLGKIINYYLYSEDQKIYDSVDELLKRVRSYTPTQTTYVIYPTNSFYYNQLKLLGINSSVSFTRKTDINIIKLSNLLSAFPPSLRSSIPIFTEVEKALKESLVSPQNIYCEILKQPKGQEQAITIGESQSIYYMKVLTERIRNSSNDNHVTGAAIATKTISKLITEKPMLVFIPSDKIASIDIEQEATNVFLSSNNLGFLIIPSYYDLQTICAQNKGINKGEEIDYQTGEIYTKPPQRKNPVRSPYSYTRYEKVSVTQEFEYINEELTGDALYDIDKIYGALDSNNSRENLMRNFDDNLYRIRSSSNINVRKVGDKYMIQNGRHRILYLKYFYLKNYETYKQSGHLDSLKSKVTIPMLVEHSFDEQTITYLEKIKKISSFAVLKNDIRNDKQELFLVLSSSNDVYYIGSLEDLKKLYDYLNSAQYQNPYYLCKNLPTNTIIQDKLMHHLIITLGHQLDNMSFIDLIKYLQNNPQIPNEFNLDPFNFNISFLYITYSNYINNIIENELFNYGKDLVQEEKDKDNIDRIGNIIMQILDEHPEYIELSWQKLFEILHSIRELSSYSSKYLRKCAESKGYAKKIIEELYKTNKKK